MAQPSSSSNVRSQLGWESPIGSGGPTTYNMQSLTIEPADEIAVNEYAAQGHRFDTVVAINQSWSSFGVTGPALYTEALLAVENAFGTSAPTTPAGAVTARKRVYDMPLTGSITPRTWTAQFGDASDNVNSLAYGLLTDFGLKYDREKGVDLDGVAGLAQIIQTASAFTPSPTTLADVPVLGSHVNYYLDTSGAALGTTQISDEVLDLTWGIKGLKGPRWVSDRSQASYKGHVDMRPKSDVKLSMAESSVTRAILANLRIGQTYFIRANAQGQLIDNLQTVTVTGSPTGGTFTLTYKGQTTAGIAYNAAASAVQSALTALSTVGAGNATVTGAGPYTVAFVGTLAQDTTLLTASGAALTPSGGVTVVAAPFYYLLNTDVAFRLAKIGKYSDHKGVYMRELDGVIVEDSAWNHAVMLTSQTGIATL